MSVCLDFELILARSGMLLDYHIILTTFQRKWGGKYSLITILQEAYKNAVNHTPLAQPITVTKANAVFLKQAMLMWRLSRKRMVCLSLTLFRPANEPFCQHKEVSQLKPTADFVDSDGTCRFQMVADHGQLIHRHEDLQEDQLIIDSQGLEWHQLSSKEHQDLRFCFKQTSGNLPFEYHFGSCVNECIKQASHAANYLRQQYRAKKTATQFQHNSKQSKPKGKPRTLQLTFQFAKGSLSFDENPINRLFVAKNYIAESCAERDILKLKPKSIFSLLKKLKHKQAFSKFVTVELHDFQIQWSKPPEFQSTDALYDRVA